MPSHPTDASPGPLPLIPSSAAAAAWSREIVVHLKNAWHRINRCALTLIAFVRPTTARGAPRSSRAHAKSTLLLLLPLHTRAAIVVSLLIVAAASDGGDGDLDDGDDGDGGDGDGCRI